MRSCCSKKTAVRPVGIGPPWFRYIRAGKTMSKTWNALLCNAMEIAQGNKSKAAEILGIHRRLLYEKMRQYDIEPKEKASTEQ
jgi:DNA-binding NtrC family response regulator